MHPLLGHRLQHLQEKKKEIINHFVTKYGSRNTKYWFLDGKQRQIASTAAMEKKENEEDTTVEFASDKELDLYKNVKWEELGDAYPANRFGSH